METERDANVRLRICGWAAGKLVIDERLSLPEDELDEVLPKLGEKHALTLVDTPHMIEVEFLDESDVNQRFFRFGTDKSHMVEPLKINLEDWRG